MRRTKYCLAILLVFVLSSIGILGLLTSPSMAGGASSTTEGGGGSPGCYRYKRIHNKYGELLSSLDLEFIREHPNPELPDRDKPMANAANYWDDTCFGGMWLEYPVEGNVNANGDIVISGNGSVRGGTLSRCVDVGAAVFYRLALVYYNIVGEDQNNPEALTSSNYKVRRNSNGDPIQLGLWQVKLFTASGLSGGYTTYRPEGLNWSEVKSKNDIARRVDPTIAEWSETSMFCYNPDWENVQSEFKSQSAASAKNVGSGNTIQDTFWTTMDGDAERTVLTDDDKVQINLDHYLTYSLPSVAGTYDPASTHWKVNVTVNGKTLDEARSEGIVYAVNGGNGEDDWTYSESETNMYRASNVYLNISAGESMRVCSTITYAPKILKWKKESSGDRYELEGSDGSGSSTICITVKRDEEEPEPEIPEPASGLYTSKTTVKIGVQGSDILQDYDLETDEDKVSGNSILISTDMNEVTVWFWHNIIYNGTACPDTPVSSSYHSYCNNLAWTKYTVTDTDADDNETTVVSETTHTGDSAEHGKHNVVVHLNPGETKTVCSRIDYSPKNLTLKYDRRYHGNIFFGHYDRYYYYDSDTARGSGASAACATITRPLNPYTPNDPDPRNPGRPTGPTEGGVNAKVMYAGETSEIDWDTSTMTYSTRRLLEWQAISFQVPVSEPRNPSFSLGNIGGRSTATPCNWYLGKSTVSPFRCEIANSSSGGTHQRTWNGGDNGGYYIPSSFSVNVRESIVVPNEVGSKHCNSFGFKFAYYYGITKNGNTTWKRANNLPYWQVYDAACLTIAKKPSVSIWNGGLSIGNGGVITSIANRYDNTSLNTLEPGGNLNAFGSWTEYVAAINGSVNGLSSGAALTGGYPGRIGSTNLEMVSPLTISNSDPLHIGGSGIGTNSILRERMEQYFFAATNVTNWGNTIGDETFSTTTIIKVDSGILNITGNITLGRSGASTIYNYPQVIIYAPDGINISSNVTQIDAWLITDHTLKTCSDFRLGTTQALVYGHSVDTECSSSLKINGPVFAKNVELNRTYGADGISNSDRDLVDTTHSDSRAATAEIFNLGADSYLWAYAQSGRYSSSYTEAYSRELPPRY